MSALVQEKATTFTTLSPDSTPANGSICEATVFNTSGTTSAYSGGGQTWSQKDVKSVGTGQISKWRCIVASWNTSSACQPSVSRASQYVHHFAEYSGLSASPDDNHSNASGTSTNPATASITPTASALVTVGFGALAGTYSSGPTNGFTRLTAVSNASGVLETGYKVAVTGSISSDITLTGSVDWGALAMAYLEATTAPPVFPSSAMQTILAM